MIWRDCGICIVVCPCEFKLLGHTCFLVKRKERVCVDRAVGKHRQPCCNLLGRLNCASRGGAKRDAFCSLLGLASAQEPTLPGPAINYSERYVYLLYPFAFISCKRCETLLSNQIEVSISETVYSVSHIVVREDGSNWERGMQMFG